MTETLPLNSVRTLFPLLSQQVHGKPLVYLDNAATAQKPNAVIEALNDYYRRDNANVHRGLHALSERATEAMEAARGKIQRFINAAESAEIIFTRGTTESINLVAHGFALQFLKPGDEVLITAMEHHSNIVPWQLACERSGARLQVAAITRAGEVDMNDFKAKLSERTRLLAVGHVSNALGTVNPLPAMISLARRYSPIAVLVDGAQAVAHLPVDVQQLDADFYVFSGHKLYGPTGIGVLYGKRRWLEQLPVYQGGGDMIRKVTFAKTQYAPLPSRFEAGTPHIAGCIGLGAAIDFFSQWDWPQRRQLEQQLLDAATEGLDSIEGVRLIGTAADKTSLVSFTMDDIHPHDLGTFLDHEGIAVRAGHHCAMPVMDFYGVPATVRASFAIYNTLDDVDRLLNAVQACRRFFCGQ
ncbi:MAG: cysteine desulfurase [Exilibacterium sp.]